MIYPENAAFGEIAKEFKISMDYRISRELYEGFLALFGDHHALHTDDHFATGKGFSGRVMHGAILNGFLSHFIGMHFPGAHSLLQSVNIQYRSPCYLGDEIRLESTVIQKVDALKVLILEFSIFNLTRNVKAASARVQVGWLA